MPSFLFFLACNEIKEKNSEEEKEKVRAVFANWANEITENQSTESFFKYVTEDFMLIEAGSDIENEIGKIEADLNAIFEENTLIVENWESQEVIVLDEIAIHRYSGIVVLKSKIDTSKHELNLNYLDILKRDKNKEWKVYIHTVVPKN
jgi:ketosteroid isomerase-like protein